MFTDKRSKKVVLVAHCVINQNARLDECAHFPGAMPEIARTLVDSGVGIVQLPCPELHCLGLDRAGQVRDGRKIGIREALLEESSAITRRDLVKGVMRDVNEYIANNFEVIGVVGINGSPACGVEFTHYAETGYGPGTGALMLALQESLKEAGLELPWAAVQDFEWEEGLRRVKGLLEAAK
jgi:predicted secreted protein